MPSEVNVIESFPLWRHWREEVVPAEQHEMSGELVFVERDADYHRRRERESLARQRRDGLRRRRREETSCNCVQQQGISPAEKQGFLLTKVFRILVAIRFVSASCAQSRYAGRVCGCAVGDRELV